MKFCDDDQICVELIPCELLTITRLGNEQQMFFFFFSYDVDKQLLKTFKIES